jgi:hypothetical protein
VDNEVPDLRALALPLTDASILPGMANMSRKATLPSYSVSTIKVQWLA